MRTISLAIFLLKMTGILGDCTTESYAGNVSVTDGGRTCQRWADQFPHRHMFNTSDFFWMDVSIEEASNYCRPLDQTKAWCYTTDKHLSWQWCEGHICAGKIPCGGLLTDDHGTILADTDSVDTWGDCLWTITAPQGKIIELNVESFNLDSFSQYPCQLFYRTLFPIRHFLQIYDEFSNLGTYCGESKRLKVWSQGSILYVRLARFRSDGRKTMLNASYSHVLPEVSKGPVPNVFGDLLCPPDVDPFHYSGNVSAAYDGQPCLDWSSLTSENDMFKIDGSAEKAKNYCRNIMSDYSLPGCYTSEERVSQTCIMQICPVPENSTFKFETTTFPPTTVSEFATVSPPDDAFSTLEPSSTTEQTFLNLSKNGSRGTHAANILFAVIFYSIIFRQL